jgi:hypothetical protein
MTYALPIQSLAAEQLGDNTGNGGHAVICPWSSPDLGHYTAMSLDLYEASQWGFYIDLGPNDLGFIRKALFALERIREFDPVRFRQYRQWLKEFESELDIRPNLAIQTTDHGSQATFPEGCKVEQLAYQVEGPRLPHEARYLVEQKVWDKLSENSRAALILHEIVYREAAALGHQTSRFVRFYVAHMVSGKVNESKENYLQLLLTIGFPYAED